MYLRKNVLVLLGIILLDVMSFGILIPVLPMIFSDMTLPVLVSNPSTNSLLWYSLVLGAHPICAFFSAPYLGVLSDRVGRKKILILALMGSVLGFGISVIGVQFSIVGLLLIGRLIDGGTAGNIAIARAALLDQFPDDTTPAVGVIGALFGIGMISGPLLGGLSVNMFGLSQGASTLLIATALSMTAAIMTAIFFRETHKQQESTVKSSALPRLLPKVELDIKPHIVVGILYVMAFGMFTTYWAFYLFSEFNLSQSEISKIFIFTGVAIAVSQGLVVRFFSKIEPRTILMNTLPLLALSLVLLSVVSLSWVYPAIAWFCLWNGLVGANRLSMISSYGEKYGQGYISGVDAAYGSLAAACSPLLLGVFILFGKYVPFWIMALLVIIALWFVILGCKSYRAE